MSSTSTVIAVALAALFAALGASPGQAQLSAPWATSQTVKAHNSTVRLVAGARAADTATRSVVAGIDIRLGEGWKTYWRHPGDSGGMPPAFDWTGSSNLKSAHVLFPAPHRLVDQNGQSVGYKHQLMLPVEIEAQDASRPVVLRLALDYGICREICVPVEAKLELTVPPTIAGLPADLAAALSDVPRSASLRREGDPKLKSARAVLSNPAPRITFEIEQGGVSGPIDLLAEAPDGVYLPMTAKLGDAQGGVQRFVIDLKGVDDVPQLAGKPLRLTILTPAGGVEADWVIK